MADLNKMMEEIKGMSVMELNELVKMLETEFGVSAAAMAVAGPLQALQLTLPQLKNRPNSTSSLRKSAETRSPLSRLYVKSPVSDSAKLKPSLTELPPP